GNELLESQPAFALDSHRDLVRDIAGLAHRAPRRLDRIAVEIKAAARRFCHAQVGLAGPDQQSDDVPLGLCGEWLQMLVVELPVGSGAGVDVASVDSRR